MYFEASQDFINNQQISNNIETGFAIENCISLFQMCEFGLKEYGHYIWICGGFAKLLGLGCCEVVMDGGGYKR